MQTEVTTNGKPENVVIWTYEGPGWKEVYEVKPNGDQILIYNAPKAMKKHDLSEATAITRTENLSWSEYCRKYRDNPSYKCTA